jgi:hypothetical protein
MGTDANYKQVQLVNKKAVTYDRSATDPNNVGVMVAVLREELAVFGERLYPV